MQHESTPTQIDETVAGISPDELKLHLSKDGTQYESIFSEGGVRFDRTDMTKAFGRIFQTICIEAVGRTTYPTFECPNEWPCNQCSIGNAVAESRVRIATNKPQLP